MFKAEEGKKPKRYSVETKKRKGFEEKLLLAVPRAIFKGKGRKNNQNDTQTKQNEKKRKGFEKELLVAIPKDQEPFSRQRKEK